MATNPRVIPILFGNSDQNTVAEVQSFYQALVELHYLPNWSGSPNTGTATGALIPFLNNSYGFGQLSTNCTAPGPFGYGSVATPFNAPLVSNGCLREKTDNFTDDDLVAFLTCEIGYQPPPKKQTGPLEAPQIPLLGNGSPLWYPQNTIYAFHLGAGVHVTNKNGEVVCGPHAGGGTVQGYHTAAPWLASHMTLNYTVVGACNGVGTGAQFDLNSGTAFHEVVEAITDPQPIDSAHGVFAKGWSGSGSSNEVADICGDTNANQPSYIPALGQTVYGSQGWVVPQIYSIKTHACSQIFHMYCYATNYGSGTSDTQKFSSPPGLPCNNIQTDLDMVSFGPFGQNPNFTWLQYPMLGDTPPPIFTHSDNATLTDNIDGKETAKIYVPWAQDQLEIKYNTQAFAGRRSYPYGYGTICSPDNQTGGFSAAFECNGPPNPNCTAFPYTSNDTIGTNQCCDNGTYVYNFQGGIEGPQSAGAPGQTCADIVYLDP